MFIRIFIRSNTVDEAKEVYQNLINETKQFIKSEKIEKIEPYWKYDDTHVIEANILLNCHLDSIQFKEFLYKISDKWEFFGIPVDEALASRNVDGCKYIIDEIDMINIFY
ncbi:MULTISPECIES: hypothetical protein [Clostridium]|uniref:hypothetical protein n=1 Tax=Clostridium TaxID=1485 RepID=UPI001EEE67E8|nr:MULTISPECIES: hypothetical protein [Clostridium]WRY51045.1 hypothetical protein P8F83_20750 [Clostridium intestinale]